jgi:hypothetical protein
MHWEDKRPVIAVRIFVRELEQTTLYSAQQQAGNGSSFIGLSCFGLD